MAHLLSCAISAVFIFIGLHAASVQATCASSWCLNGGMCDDDPMGCVCLEGFAGFYCEIELTGDESCVESSCLNGGICMAEAVVCSCEDGFTGYFCETEVCQYDTDCNGGECVNDSSSSIGEFECVACRNMFAGPRCETPFGPLCGMMTDGICLNGGTCIPRPDSTQGFTCMCPENYAGPHCQVYKICSDINPCRNDGDCVGGSCTCVDTFVGVLCERSCTGNAQCLNGGACSPTGVCQCMDGYEGARCGLVPCTPENMDCLNDGTCNADGACECINNFQGRKCEIACKGNARCMNGATCSDTGACLCPNGYEGARCEMRTEPCVENRDCLNGGSCIIADGICECESDFEGTFCEIACTTDGQCMNGGSCEASGMCECVNGFKGARCKDSASSIDVTLIVAVVAGVVVLLLVIVLLLLLVRKRLARRRLPKGQNGQLELGVRNTSRGNSYIGVNDGGRPPVANRPGELKYETGGKPKEFPRDWLHVMEQLGAGSFATVHRAEADGIIKKGAMTTVAIKMLKPTATEGDKSDFEKERSMYLTLGSHPNVVTMMGFCTEKEPFYLIMEYLPNGNLQTYLRHVRTGSQEQYFDLKEAKEEKRNFLVPAEILSFANQIANGMEFLASKSCIHRDLATRNILLGDDLVAKVSDFGLARDVQDSSQYEMKSKGRVPVRWMAPESLLDNIYTSKSDVWGFAVLLWELVTLGSHPYPGMSSKQVMDQVGVGYRLPKPESCSDEIYNMMKRCWNKNPQDRPTFTEICKLLDEMMADAGGYLVMSDLKREDYLYLEPNQTKSVNTADDY